MTHRLKSGEHLWGVLRKYELDNAERRRWLAALQRSRYVRRLRAGSNINFYFEAPANGNGKASANGNGAPHSNGAGNLQALEIVLRSDLRLTWYRKQKDILFYKDEVPYQQEVRTVSGVINGGSLYDNARSAGVDPAVISQHGGRPCVGHQFPEGHSRRRHLPGALPEEVPTRQRGVQPGSGYWPRSS